MLWLMSSPLGTPSQKKPACIARWEERQQAKFDRQQADWPAKRAEFEARNVWVDSPDGDHCVVLAVRMGKSFLVRGGIFSEIVHTAGAADKRQRWAVGVVRHTAWTDKVLWREYLPVGADEKARVAEVAEEVRSGNLDVGWRFRPSRAR